MYLYPLGILPLDPGALPSKKAWGRWRGGAHVEGVIVVQIAQE